VLLHRELPRVRFDEKLPYSGDGVGDITFVVIVSSGGRLTAGFLSIGGHEIFVLFNFTLVSERVRSLRLRRICAVNFTVLAKVTTVEAVSSNTTCVTHLTSGRAAVLLGNVGLHFTVQVPSGKASLTSTSALGIGGAHAGLVAFAHVTRGEHGRSEVQGNDRGITVLGRIGCSKKLKGEAEPHS